MRGKSFKLVCSWRNLSLKEKSIFLMLFAVLLPTLVLFYGQYRVLSELRDKSKAVFENDLRQTFFEIEDKTEDRLREAARRNLEDLPDSFAENWNAPQIEKGLQAVLDKNAGLESAFVFVAHNDTLKLAINSRADGYRESKTATNPSEAVIYTKNGAEEEDVIVPMVSALQSSKNQRLGDDYLMAQYRCQACSADASAPVEILDLYRVLADSNDYKTLRFVGVRLKRDYLVEEFLSPVVRETAVNSTKKLEADVICGVFDAKKNLLFSNDATAQNLDDFEMKTAISPSFPLWTAAGSFRDNRIEDLTDSYFWRGLIIMTLIFSLLVLGVNLLLGVAGREVNLAEAKSAFVSNVSHELKTPLALIRLFAETLSSGRVTKPEKIKEYYRIITTETVRLTHLINNILDFSAIEAGRKEYNFAPCDVSETVAKVVDNYSYGLENAGFTVKTHYESDLPLIEIDCDAISQTVLNLLNNATKYSADEKYIEISVERRGANVAVEITDHGIGIAPNEQTKIFDNFYRVGGSSDVHNVKGSGLGLALVKHIAEAHGGRITVNSVLHRGSTFTLLLPVEKTANK